VQRCGVAAAEARICLAAVTYQSHWGSLMGTVEAESGLITTGFGSEEGVEFDELGPSLWLMA
jgi:membrane-bound lytic murein transglycosylase B